MSITPPTVAPVTVDLPVDVFRAGPDVQPFTYRSAMTYTQILESMRRWIFNTLVPYLNTNFQDVQGSWADNVTAVTNAVNTALQSQQNAVDQELSTALAEIVAGANTALNDATILATLESAGSTALAYLDARYGAVYYAPAPSGGDDTATLQALVSAAGSTNGEVILQHGTYLANLTLGVRGQIPVPAVRGRGERQTVIRSFNNGLPAVTIKGAPGATSGGGVHNLGIDGNSGIALQYNGATRVLSDGLHIFNAAVGVDFFNEDSGTWTEFCTVEAAIDSCVYPVHYRKASGNESFSGSGLVGNTLINLDPTSTTAILIDQGCLPYNSPLSAEIVPAGSPGQVAGQVAITNLHTGRAACTFFGTLRSEGIQKLAADGPNTSKVWYAGTLLSLSGLPARLGNLYMVDKAYFGNNGPIAQYRPFQRVTSLQSGVTNVLPDDVGGGMIVSVDITGPNYHAGYQLLVWRSPYDLTGVVTVLAHPETIDPGNIGMPVFSYNKGLIVTNGNYSNAHSAYVATTPLNDTINYDRFAQY